MPPKSCPCVCPAKRAKRSSKRKPRAVPRRFPAPGVLIPTMMTSQVPIQAPMLQMPVRKEVEKITKGTQTSFEPKKTSEVGLQAGVHRAVSEMGVGTEPVSRGEMEVQTEMSMAGGKEIYARQPRRTAEEVAMERAAEEITKGSQATITKFFGKK